MNYFKTLSPFKKRYIPIFSGMILLFVISLIFIFTFPIITHQIITSPENKSSKSGWPIRLAAPYIDMSSWVDASNAYSLNGAPNLAKLYDDSGVQYFNLGFIQPDTTTPLSSDGNIRWGWGGYYSLSKNGSDTSQYNGIVQSMTDLRAKGGDFAISIGGQAGDAPWVVTQNQKALENFYLDVIETYELKRMDLDIEESNQDQDQNIINAKAIKNVQDKTNVEITLTIPIMPSGWEQKQINIITAYLDAGVDVSVINSMTMCYGTGVYANEDYGTASVRAIDNAVKQLKSIYSNRGVELTDDQAYLKIGATFSIGYESNLYPVFTTTMASTIVEDAKQHNYGLVSMWSVGRDAMLESNSAITTKFEFTKILLSYNDDKN
jgi:chitinase